jgi:hypothetical protein
MNLKINPRSVPYIILLIGVFVVLGISLICIFFRNEPFNNNNIITNNVWTRRGQFRQWSNLSRRMNDININMLPLNSVFITMFGSQPGNNFSYIIYTLYGKYGIMKRSSDNNNILFRNDIIVNQIDNNNILGQGCVIYGNNGQNEPELDMLIIPCKNGKIQFRNKNTLNLLNTTNLSNLNELKWVDMDPVTNHLLVPNSYKLLNAIKAYQISLNPYNLRFKLDIPLNIPVENVISGRLSYNGHLYLLSEPTQRRGAVISCYEINVRLVDRQPIGAILRQTYPIPLLANENVKSMYIDSPRALLFVFVVNNQNMNAVKILKISLGLLGSANI